MLSVSTSIRSTYSHNSFLTNRTTPPERRPCILSETFTPGETKGLWDGNIESGTVSVNVSTRRTKSYLSTKDARSSSLQTLHKPSILKVTNDTAWSACIVFCEHAALTWSQLPLKEKGVSTCSLASSSLGLRPDHYFLRWVSLSLMPADSPTGEESRAPADPEPVWCQVLGSLPCREEEKVELWDRFLVNIGEERDWHLGF